MKSESQKIGNNRCCPKATVAAICSVALLAASVVVCRCARKDVGRVAQSGASPHEAAAIHLPVRLPPVVLGEEAKRALSERVWNDEAANARFASEKNQVMDALLDQPQIPSDYGETMMKLYRDRKQDVLTRDFAVQHIGLYAQALNRRGEYDAASAESQKLRLALFDAAGETRTIVAAAAFRALSDMSAFDSRIDAGRLDSLLARCAADPSAAPAARAMAVQLCGERRIASSRMALEEIAADESAPEILRRSARHSISLLDKGGSR